MVGSRPARRRPTAATGGAGGGGVSPDQVIRSRAVWPTTEPSDGTDPRTNSSVGQGPGGRLASLPPSPGPAPLPAPRGGRRCNHSRPVESGRGSWTPVPATDPPPDAPSHEDASRAELAAYDRVTVRTIRRWGIGAPGHRGRTGPRVDPAKIDDPPPDPAPLEDEEPAARDVVTIAEVSRTTVGRRYNLGRARYRPDVDEVVRRYQAGGSLKTVGRAGDHRRRRPHRPHPGRRSPPIGRPVPTVRSRHRRRPASLRGGRIRLRHRPSPGVNRAPRPEGHRAGGDGAPALAVHSTASSVGRRGGSTSVNRRVTPSRT